MCHVSLRNDEAVFKPNRVCPFRTHPINPFTFARMFHTQTLALVVRFVGPLVFRPRRWAFRDLPGLNLLPETGTDQISMRLSCHKGLARLAQPALRTPLPGRQDPVRLSRGYPQYWSDTVDRAQKEKVVEELGQIFESSGVVVVAHYEGLTVAEMQDLRARAREAETSVRVAKNRLAKIALEGKPCESIGNYLSGMTVLTFSEDPVAAAKVAESFAKDNKKFEILGGAMGNTALDRAGVEATSKLPSREELISTIAGMIGAPASNIAGAIGAPASNIASILSTIEEKAEAA